jgi:hypothetical protein
VTEPAAPRLAALPCRFCAAQGLQLEPDGRAVCRFCGTENAIEGVVCPHCECINLPSAAGCAHCGLPQQAVCPACGHLNWSGREACAACRAPLDAIARMASARFGADPANFYSDLQRSAPAIKASEEAASQQRMAALEAIEARRQQNIEAARQRKAAEERLMLMILGVVLGLGLVGIAAALLLGR